MSASASEMEPIEADAGLSKNVPPLPNHEDEGALSSIPSDAPICPLCCDEDSTSMAGASTVVLSACQHRSCVTCLVKWVERMESSGRLDLGPTCPFCRVGISECDVLRLMGRPFRPRMMEDAAVGEVSVVDDEIDELTLHWINEHTKACPYCGNCVEKSDGCDHMECLCGYQFCYSCGGAYGRCECCDPYDRFDCNNGLGEPLRDNDGRVDLRLCMRRREVRKERSDRYRDDQRYIIQNATWLFLRRGAEFKAMDQLHIRDNIRGKCERKDEDNSNEQRIFSNWDCCFGYHTYYMYGRYWAIHDRLLKSLKNRMIIGDRRVEENLNRFSIVLEQLENEVMCDVALKITYLDWEDNWDEDNELWARWGNEYTYIVRYERSICRCRQCRRPACYGCDLRSSHPCGSGFLADGTPQDSAYVALRKMTGASRKKTRRETARKSSKKSSRSKPGTKMPPKPAARWKRRKAQLSWSED